MTLNSQEFLDIMAAFERLHGKELPRLDKEDKSLWPNRRYYQNGETNQAFLFYQNGYAQGRAAYLNQ